jgi:hypothetical protein
MRAAVPLCREQAIEIEASLYVRERVARKDLCDRMTA